MSDLPGYRGLIDGCAIVPSDTMSLHFLAGEDALEWLNGQVTQEVTSMGVGETRAGCLCSVTGQIEAVLWIARLSDRIAVQTSFETEARLLERIETSVFMEDVRVQPVLETWRPILVCGARAGEMIPHTLISDGILLVSPTPGRGFVYWGPQESEISRSLTTQLSVASEESWEAYRIETARPRWGKDIDPKTLPPELGAKFLEEHVSYTKGCYIGQEVLMRIYARGHPNRTWVGIMLSEPVFAGSVVSTKNREKAGLITSAANSPKFGPIAAAMLHRDSAAAGTAVQVETPKGQLKGKVCELPLRTSK